MMRSFEIDLREYSLFALVICVGFVDEAVECFIDVAILSIGEDFIGHVDEFLSNDVVDAYAEDGYCLVGTLKLLALIL